MLDLASDLGILVSKISGTLRLSRSEAVSQSLSRVGTSVEPGSSSEGVRVHPEDDEAYSKVAE